jgi:hypothetical protein
MFPGEPPEQQCRAAALLFGERPLDGPFEMVDLPPGYARLALQASPLFGQPGLDDLFDRLADLNEPGG